MRVLREKVLGFDGLDDVEGHAVVVRSLLIGWKRGAAPGHSATWVLGRRDDLEIAEMVENDVDGSSPERVPRERTPSANFHMPPLLPPIVSSHYREIPSKMRGAARTRSFGASLNPSRREVGRVTRFWPHRRCNTYGRATCIACASSTGEYLRLHPRILQLGKKMGRGAFSRGRPARNRVVFINLSGARRRKGKCVCESGFADLALCSDASCGLLARRADDALQAPPVDENHPISGRTPRDLCASGNWRANDGPLGEKPLRVARLLTA